MAICESCVDAFIDEGLDEDCPIDLFPLDLGMDIADHLCDEVEIGGEIKCDCACTMRFRPYRGRADIINHYQ